VSKLPVRRALVRNSNMTMTLNNRFERLLPALAAIVQRAEAILARPMQQPGYSLCRPFSQFF